MTILYYWMQVDLLGFNVNLYFQQESCMITHVPYAHSELLQNFPLIHGNFKANSEEINKTAFQSIVFIVNKYRSIQICESKLE